MPDDNSLRVAVGEPSVAKLGNRDVRQPVPVGTYRGLRHFMRRARMRSWTVLTIGTAVPG